MDEEFRLLQTALMFVLGPIISWALALTLAATVGAAFLELYFEFGNWLMDQASN